MIDPTEENEQKKFLRSIFLNIFIEVFIIISYVYFSEAFGSISTFFIESRSFSIQFGITLFFFSFFSILGGASHGLISGFLSEFLFEFVYYERIYFEWCLVVAIFGFLCGLYRYKPLKYHEGMKVYYTFLALIITSFIIMGIIIWFQFLFYPSQDNIENVVINYGFKFLIQALISIIFLVPIFLIIYDKVFASEKKSLYYLLLTHHPISASDHTFYLEFGRTKIFFCSRCSGVIIGGLVTLFTTHILENIYNTEFSGEIALILCIVLPIPGLIDWGTQRLLLRKSTTESRIFTGFIIGAALHLMSYTYRYYLYTLLLLTIYFTIFGLLIYFGHKKEMKLLKAEFEEYSTQEEIEE